MYYPRAAGVTLAHPPPRAHARPIRRPNIRRPNILRPSPTNATLATRSNM